MTSSGRAPALRLQQTTDRIIVHFVRHFFDHDAVARGSEQKTDSKQRNFDVTLCAKDVWHEARRRRHSKRQ
jgi:hypothetical protein